MFTLMCDIFIMCFALFLFVTCFGWNFNTIAAVAAAAAAVVVVAAAVAAAAGGGGLSGCNYDEHRNLPYFPYHFTIQLTFPPCFPGEALRGTLDRILRKFRLRMRSHHPSNGIPWKGLNRVDIVQLPVAHVHTSPKGTPSRWRLMTSLPMKRSH